MSGTALMHAVSVSARSEEHIDDVDAQQLPQQDVLIQPWSSTEHRLSKPADEALPSAAHTFHPSPQPGSAILPSQNNFTNNNGQDVLDSLSVRSGPQNLSSPLYRNGQPRILESPALPSPSHTFHHGSINVTNNRPRTNLPVFGTTSTLAAYHGIPTRLPPIPRINSSNNNSNHIRPPVPRFHESVPSSSATPINYQYQNSAPADNTIPNLQNLMADYMKMLNDKPEEHSGASAPSVPSSPAKAPNQLEPMAANNFSNMLFGSANDFTAAAWDEYLTSPFIDDESPFESFLDTPAAPTMSDFFHSPLVADAGANSISPSFADLPLVGTAGYSENDHDFSKMSLEVAPPPSSTSSTASGSASPVKPPAPNFDGMIIMSPATPALEPSSAQTSPVFNDVSMISPNPNTGGRKKKVPTGTRKNVTPESLVPIDAPTQPRSYVLPSTTSRKAVPAVFARKRARSSAFGDDEEDELAGSDGGALDLPVDPTEAEAIAAKRRQNTLAARRSRKRKLEYQRELEEGIEAERREKEMWRERAMMLRAQVMALGMPEPFREA